MGLVVPVAPVVCSRATAAMAVSVVRRRRRPVLVVRAVPAGIPGCCQCSVVGVPAVMAATVGLSPVQVALVAPAVMRGHSR